MKKQSTAILLLPLFFAFFVMGFCDVIGVTTSYMKDSFGLSEAVAGFLPSVLFIWFLLLSIPVGSIMNRVGRKNMVQISNVVTFVGMVLPFLHYSLPMCIVAIAMLGIGNTILQVALNPLVSNVVADKRLTSAITGGQVVKAVSSMLGPVIAAFAATRLGNWMYIFPIYAGVILIEAVWLQFTPIPREEISSSSVNVGEAFKLLGNKDILLFFFGIMTVCGVDGGLNLATPKLLMERCGLAVAKAGLGSSVYFLCRTCGAFLGTFLLLRMDNVKYFRIFILITLAAVAMLFASYSEWMILFFVGLAGFSAAAIFSVIFGQAMLARPDKKNEVSGLMITGVCGAGVVAPLMGLLASGLGNQNGSIAIILLCAAYLCILSFVMKPASAKEA